MPSSVSMGSPSANTSLSHMSVSNTSQTSTTRKKKLSMFLSRGARRISTIGADGKGSDPEPRPAASAAEPALASLVDLGAGHAATRAPEQAYTAAPSRPTNVSRNSGRVPVVRQASLSRPSNERLTRSGVAGDTTLPAQATAQPASTAPTASTTPTASTMPTATTTPTAQPTQWSSHVAAASPHSPHTPQSGSHPSPSQGTPHTRETTPNSGSYTAGGANATSSAAYNTPTPSPATYAGPATHAAISAEPQASPNPPTEHKAAYTDPGRASSAIAEPSDDLSALLPKKTSVDYMLIAFEWAIANAAEAAPKVEPSARVSVHTGEPGDADPEDEDRVVTAIMRTNSVRRASLSASHGNVRALNGKVGGVGNGGSLANGAAQSTLAQGGSLVQGGTSQSTSLIDRRQSLSERPGTGNGVHRSRRVLGEWTMTKTLGAGSMGKVKLAVSTVSGDKAAIKIVPRFTSTLAALKTQGPEIAGLVPDAGHRAWTRENSPSFLVKAAAKDASKETRTLREGSLSLLLYHPYVCGMRSMVIYPHHYYLVTEYIDGGQMLDYIISHGRLRERSARKFARQIASALYYCHANSVVHRDLKIENILISHSGNIKIIDFGLSNLYSPMSHLSTFCGSLYFAAPELLNARPYVGPEVDIWSFGVVLFVLVCGKVPFDDQNMPALHAKIKRGAVEYPAWLSSECKHLLSRMLVTDVKNRATLDEILNHPWMIRHHAGPPNTHIPDRTPLKLEELDDAIIKQMTGFEFGDEREIRRDLRRILSSDLYKQSVAAWYKNSGYGGRGPRARGTAGAQGLNGTGKTSSLPPPAPPLSTTLSNTSNVSTGSRRMSGLGFYSKKIANVFRPDHNAPPTSDGGYTAPPPPQLPNTDLLDPTRAFHPLLSIYYLVRERNERERIYGPGQFASSSVSVTGPPPPLAPVSAYQAGNTAVEARQYELSTLEKAARGAAEKNTTAVTPEKATPPPPPPTSVHFSKPRPRARPDEVGYAGYATPSARPLNGVSRGTGAYVLPQSGSQSTQGGDKPLKYEGGTVGKPTSQPMAPRSQSSGSSLVRRFSAFLGGRSEARSESHADSRVGETRSSMAPAEPRSSFAPTQVQVQPVVPPSPVPASSMASPLPMPATSVTATSASPAPAVTATNMQRSQSVSVGKSPATSRPPDAAPLSVGRPVTATPRKQTVSAQTPPRPTTGTRLIGRSASVATRNVPVRDEPSDIGESRDAPGTPPASAGAKPVWLKGMFSVSTTSTKPTAVIRNDLIEVLGHLGVTYRESKNTLECLYSPSIRLASNNTALIANATGDPASTSNFNQTLSSGNNSPDYQVRFEISIVKMPLLPGIHGIQFRRISGDSWQYQMLAKRVLEEVKL